MVWYSHLFKNFPQFFVICIVKGFSIGNEAEEEDIWPVSWETCMQVGKQQLELDMEQHGSK